MASLLLLLYISALLALLVAAAVTLHWQMYAWRSPANLTATRFDTEPTDPTRSFSLIVPARHEEVVLAATLEGLTQLDHPAYEVLVVVGHDDPGTAAVAEECAARWPELIRVVVDDHEVKNKPRALNTALPHCRGDVVGVFDAEDEVDPGLLRRVDTCFTTGDADIVQGGVQLMNFRSNWYSLRNCLEYFFWFRSRLPLQAARGFIPLGGNTVFVKRLLLEQASGWDEACLAEDCDIGVRLSVAGARTVVAYEPHLVTREETPPTLREFIKQRTRWNQGFLQVFSKGVWKELPTRRQRALALATLATPFFQALTALAIPVALTTFFLDVPELVALLSFVPLAISGVALTFEAIALGEFARIYYQRVRVRDYVRLALGIFPFQVLLGIAAVRAVSRHLRGEHGWEKTSHVGAHLHQAQPALSTTS